MTYSDHCSSGTEKSTDFLLLVNQPASLEIPSHPYKELFFKSNEPLKIGKRSEQTILKRISPALFEQRKETDKSARLFATN